jgi:hypothetical protein
MGLLFLFYSAFKIILFLFVLIRNKTKGLCV